MRMSRFAGSGAIVMAMSSPLLAAPIPQGVEAMITAASDSGNADTLKTTVDLAKKTNPDSQAEIDALVAGLKKTAEAQRIAKLESEGFLEGWKGEGQAGLSVTTGNTEGRATSLGLKFEKDALRWRQVVQATEDYTRQDDVTSQNRAFASYEGNYKFADRWYGLGIGSWERDQFAGFDRRFSESLGLGYTAVNTPDMKLRLEAGPSYRQTRYITGETENKVGLRLATNYTWTISPGVDFSENAIYYVQSDGSTITSTTALTAKIRGALSLRASFLYTHEEQPPLGLKRTDTTTRVTLVYSF